MDKQETIRLVLAQLGMPQQQQSPLCCLTLLALAQISKRAKWTTATNPWLRIHDVMEFIRDEYKTPYAENSRETFRKQAMHPFRTAALIEDNGLATNSPNYRYRITEEFLLLLRNIDMNGRKLKQSTNMLIKEFVRQHGMLTDIYASKKKMQMMSVCINSEEFSFSPGKHNALQKAIVEEFAPRFAPRSICLYIGDTIKKDLVKDVDLLKEIGFDITLHDKMPDVVLYNEEKDWIYFVEAVTSVGPMSPKRILEIEAMP